MDDLVVPDDDLVLVERIDQIAERFEAAWKNNPPASLHDHLPDQADNQRANILQELVQIDLEYRIRGGGERRKPEDYLADFPELGQDPNGALPDELVLFARQLEKQYCQKQNSLLQSDGGYNSSNISAADTMGHGSSSSSIGTINKEKLFAPNEDICLPMTVGKFQLIRLLGSGSFGLVYLARDCELRRQVAIKMPQTGRFSTPQQRERFLREARNAASLYHPYIVSVYEVDSESGLPLIVSEYVDGENLSDHLKHSRPNVMQAARWVFHVAEALDYSHKNGVIHRDVKPHNILIDKDGQPRVTDFGLALHLASDATLTTEGQILGAPAYMSPEQAEGQSHKVDARSDIYSLGTVLYELLTGEQPFSGTTHMLLHQVLNDEPRPLRKLNNEIPRDLETICLKAMAKSPARRYGTAAALADDLNRFLQGKPVHARRIGSAERVWRWSRRNPVVASLTSAVALLLVVATIVSIVGYVNTSAALTAANQALGHKHWNDGLRHRDNLGKPLTAAHYFALASQHFAEHSTESINAQLAANVLAQRVQIQLLLEDEQFLDFSQDQSRFLTWKGKHSNGTGGGAVRAWNCEKGNVFLELPHDAFTKARFTDNDTHILTWSSDNVVRLWSVTNGKPVFESQGDQGIDGAVVNEDRTCVACWSSEPHKSPNGSEVLPQYRKGSLRLWNSESAETIFDVKHDQPVANAVFSKNGRLILYHSMRPIGFERNAKGWAYVVDAQSGDVLIELTHDHAITQAGFSEDESRVLTICDDTSGDWGEVRLWDVNSGELLMKLAPGERVDGAVLMKDKRRVLTWGSVLSKDHPSFVRLWDVETGEILVELKHNEQVNGSVLTGDEKRVLTWSDGPTVSGGGIIRLWDLATASELVKLQHNSFVKGAALTRGESHILSWTKDGSVRMWNANTGSALVELKHGESVDKVVVTTEERHVLTWSNDGRLCLWLLNTDGASVESKYSERVNGAAFTDDQTQVLSWGGNGTVRLWDAKTGKNNLEVRHGYHCDGAELIEDESRLLTWNHWGTMRIWDVSTGAMLFECEHDGMTINAAVFDRNKSRVLFCSSEGTARLWDTKTGALLNELDHNWLDHNTQAIFGAKFTNDQNQVLTWSGDGAVRLWDAETGTVVMKFKREFRVIHGVAFTRDERRILTWGNLHPKNEGFVHLWNAKTGELLLDLSLDRPVDQAKFSNDEGQILSCHGDMVRVWDAATGDIVIALKHPIVSGAVFSKDESQILSWGLDGAVRLWDVDTGLPVTEMKHDDWVNGAILSADQHRILSWSNDATVRCWGIASGDLLVQLNHIAPVKSAIFTTDEGHLLTWTEDGHQDKNGRVYLWNVSRDPLYGRESLLTLLEARTATHLDRHAGKLRALSRSEWLERKHGYGETK